MKLYPNLLHAVANSLEEIFRHEQYADKVIERTLKSEPRWGARDRAFIAETTYEIVRWYRLLWTILGREPVRTDDWWLIAGIHFVLGGNALPDWKEFEGLDPARIQAAFQELQANRAIRESIPDWLEEAGSQNLGDRWAPILHSLNNPAPLVLRANRIKIDPADLRALLLRENVSTTPLPGDALVVDQRRNLFSLPSFKEGLFEVQDYASQQVAPFLDIAPGMRVVDACAGGGGKTLHLAALMQNKGQIIALDTEGWKLTELKKRARRAGASLIESRLIDSTKVIKRLEKSADRLLLDVPCTGLGVLRRNPDAKWKLSPEFLESVQKTQAHILQSYSRMLKPGGKLVYATCSILPQENEHQVTRFLENNPSFELLEQKHLWPDTFGYDGFFMASLVWRG